VVVFVATVALLLTSLVGVIAAEQLGAFYVRTPPMPIVSSRPRADARVLFCVPHGLLNANWLAQ
jgi:hypothetical protein